VQARKDFEKAEGIKYFPQPIKGTAKRNIADEKEDQKIKIIYGEAQKIVQKM
jgi:hypothetical protein